MLLACNLLSNTEDDVVAEYSGRGNNETAQLRKASSVILSLDDVIVRGKTQQIETAARYACAYADKADALVAADKLTYLPEAVVDLADDARFIASELGFPCGA